MELKNIQHITKFFSNRAYSRLGWEIGFDDLNNDGIDDLWISEPMRPSKLGRDTGIVYLFSGGRNFPTGEVRDSERKASKKWTVGKLQSRFGYLIISGKQGN